MKEAAAACSKSAEGRKAASSSSASAAGRGGPDGARRGAARGARAVAEATVARKMRRRASSPPPEGPAAKRPRSHTRQLPGGRTPGPIEHALGIYEEMRAGFRKSELASGFREACEWAVRQVERRSKVLHASALALALRVCAEVEPSPRAISAGGDAAHPLDAGTSYRALVFCGRTVATGSADSDDLSSRLAEHRRDAKGRASDALCAALACLCSRLEKVWLDSYSEELPVRGYFAHALVDPASTFRVALRPGRTPRLASLLITKEVPLAKALASMDHGGPLPEGLHAANSSPHFADCEFGFQRIASPNGRGDDFREALQDVQPQDTLARLFSSEEKVTYLDVYCALGSKEYVRQHGLGAIVKAELLALLRDARKRGAAVVFHVGGENPVTLATKVYCQPWVADIGGLQCGYLRWRERGSGAWQPMKHHTSRVVLGLQLP